MRVEFKETEFGPSLVITYNDYIKALKDGEELNSLGAAVDAYINMLCLDYSFDFDEYRRVTAFLKKGAIIYYHPLILEYPDRRELLVTVIQDNEILPIRKQLSSGSVFTCIHTTIKAKK